MRADELRAALQHATGQHVTSSQTTAGLRLTAPVPTPCVAERWAAILRVVESADQWGATDAAGRQTVWAIVREDS
ncbi:hypothetical protein OG689_27590 [Kitasatospora sp. NBC_00240]|uniref:hypothetical protein n=1 Tax=Kitasatospora sp. NBC_00240 TaxID=2903567 RepID=UPI002254A21C|nr:hypothetical protein [Kitasatospora sp. NBC_00240]MCX5212987.1 hypothetical protein [Kitasatospora sp. NBC_00240]